MPRVPLQNKLVRLATNLIPQLLSEGVITSASAALARLQIATLERVIKIQEPRPADLIVLADTTEKLLEFVSCYTECMYAIQREDFDQIQAEMSGLSYFWESPSPSRGPTAFELFRSAM